MAPARISQVPKTGHEARLQARDNVWDAPTCGTAAGYLQANLIVLPSQYATDFRILCARNPVPCPLLASSTKPGDPCTFRSHIPGVPDEAIAKSIDVRLDVPRYNVYEDGRLLATVPNVGQYWNHNDHVAFLIGCSYSFEDALTRNGLTPPHVLHGRNVTMYRSNIHLFPAGVFQRSTAVVSMRMYRRSEVERVRSVTQPYVTTHGEPIAWGWQGANSIGILDVNKPDWGDVPLTGNGSPVDQVAEEAAEDGFVPVFWGCGVTPQEAVMRARIPGTVIGHTPGYMLVLDVKEDDVIAA